MIWGDGFEIETVINCRFAAAGVVDHRGALGREGSGCSASRTCNAVVRRPPRAQDPVDRVAPGPRRRAGSTRALRPRRTLVPDRADAVSGRLTAKPNTNCPPRTQGATCPPPQRRPSPRQPPPVSRTPGRWDRHGGCRTRPVLWSGGASPGWVCSDTIPRMRVLFSSTSGFGHVFPMLPLARAFLAARPRRASGRPADAVPSWRARDRDDRVRAHRSGPGAAAGQRARTGERCRRRNARPSCSRGCSERR